MFGMICQTTGEAKTSLQLPCNATVGDAIAALGERYGAEFINQVMRTAAAKASHTQISVGGCLMARSGNASGVRQGRDHCGNHPPFRA